VLARITPITSGPFVCYVNFSIVQSAQQFGVELTDQNATFGICGTLVVPRTFYVAPIPFQAAYNPELAFTLVFDGGVGGGGLQSLEVGPAGPSGPPPTSQPSLTIVPTGCTTCHSGQTVGYRLDFTNGGAAMVVELKAGARIPGGSGLPLLNQVATIPAGSSSLTFVPLQALPSPLPTIDLTIEAAILDPIFGVTLGRQTTTLHLLP
jgi:hypothetical protein